MNPMNEFDFLSRDMEEALAEAGTAEYLTNTKPSFFSYNTNDDAADPNKVGIGFPPYNCSSVCISSAQTVADDHNDILFGSICPSDSLKQKGNSVFDSVDDSNLSFPNISASDTYSSDFVSSGEFCKAADFLNLDSTFAPICCPNTFNEFNTMDRSGHLYNLPHLDNLEGLDSQEALLADTNNVDFSKDYSYFGTQESTNNFNYSNDNNHLFSEDLEDSIGLSSYSNPPGSNFQDNFSLTELLPSSSASTGYSTLSTDDISCQQSPLFASDDAYLSTPQSDALPMDPIDDMLYRSTGENDFSSPCPSSPTLTPVSSPSNGVYVKEEPASPVSTKKRPMRKSRAKRKSSEGVQSAVNSLQRVSLMNYSDDQKKAHIREQNNRASREYRKRRKVQHGELFEQIQSLEESCEEKRNKKRSLEKQMEVMTRAISLMWQKQGTTDSK